MDEKALHKGLLRPEAYPEQTESISFRETHISRLYFTDHHVYKVKKPVDLGFLNFSTLDRRRFYCQEEVRLNARFCPDTYLGVVDIRRIDQGCMIDGTGEIVDYAVKMKRLPEERMLVRLLQKDNSALSEEMRRVARRISLLHQESEIVREEAGRNDPDAIRSNWNENFMQTKPFVGQTLSAQGQEACTSYVERFLKENASLLHRRQEQGFVRDGHGDLHAEHICLTDPVRIYDCIEFNRRFRIADIAADLAFLLMDLEFRKRKDLADITLDAYRETLPDDQEMEKLLHFYKVYRAWVRGKVESMLAADRTANQATRRAATQNSRQYFNLALGYLCPPLLVMTCGLMGVGKTTVAKGLTSALRSDLLRSDELRKELAGMPQTARRHESFGTGIYSPEMTAKTYDLLLERSLSALKAGRSVIADASFTRRTDRERFAASAARAGFGSMIIHMKCPQETAILRLDKREAAGDDASDGRSELLASQSAEFESLHEAENFICIDTSEEVDYNSHLILCSIIERFGICHERA